MSLRVIGLCLLCVFSSKPSLAIELDQLLEKIIDAYDLRPLETKPFETNPKYRLGQALFFDPLLSGAQDTSCGTCHILSRGTSDALPRSIGPGGRDLAESRVYEEDGAPHPRNSLELWNRDHNTVTSLFWDGRVEVLLPDAGLFRSPLGEMLPDGLQNTLAVQALFPLIEPSEMLGTSTVLGFSADASLPQSVFAEEDAEQALQILAAILHRLIGAPEAIPSEIQSRYRAMFLEAYPSETLSTLSIVHVANAIAHFEEIAFSTRSTPWDQYLAGNTSSISNSAKRGAITFFGKGRCSVCHSGPLFSDFQFHSIGVSNASSEPDDLGRYSVTGVDSDKYRFRTPPLRNVTQSSPYFHDGSVDSLEEAIRRHIHPLSDAHAYHETGEHLMNLSQIESVSYILFQQSSLRDEELLDLVEFLRALEDRGSLDVAQIIPSHVPSGLPVDTLD